MTSLSLKNISLKSLAIITVSSFVFALSVNLFLLSNHMGEGGITGVSILIKYAFGIDIDITYFTINAILLIIGIKELDKSTIGYTIYSLVIFTLFIRLTSQFHYQFQDIILVPIVAGTLIGGSLGFILLAGGSTAGTDIIALILKKYFGISTSTGLFIIDLFIIGPGALIIGFEKTIYTLIMLFISIKVIDYILEGLNPKKSIMIISEHHEQIAKEIDAQIERGITILHGTGYYTKKEKQILYVVVNRRQVMAISKLVQRIDHKAFTTISDVHSVSGEGFTFHLPTTSNVDLSSSNTDQN